MSHLQTTKTRLFRREALPMEWNLSLLIQVNIFCIIKLLKKFSEDIPTVESTPEVPACAEEKFEKVYCSSASPEAIEPASNKEELDQAVEGNEHGGNEIERENLISANELTGESFTVAELREG